MVVGHVYFEGWKKLLLDELLVMKRVLRYGDIE